MPYKIDVPEIDEEDLEEEDENEDNIGSYIYQKVAELPEDELPPFKPGQFQNANKKTECVEFIRQATGAPHTSLWRPGIRVQDATPGQIARGTAIATFDKKGRYPTDLKGKHAAIYLSHDSHEIKVLDQWNKKRTVSERKPPIRFNVSEKESRSNNGSTYYVIK